jgi:N-acetylglucosaminyldiphosphoundecaprenol N-acetyl-beta-D-mannosaminyltransferase
MRWEGGRFHVVRTRLGRLLVTAVRTRDWSRLDAAIDLAVPPLGLLVLVAGTGTVLAELLIAGGVIPGWGLAPWIVACAAIPAYVFIGLRAAHAPASAYRAMLRAPVFVLGKVGVYLRLARGLRADRWERTERPAEPAGDGGRVEVAGVPIDAAHMDAAVRLAMSALHSGSLLHICTVNLHFLVTARRDAGVRTILRRSSLNVADGASVVWLARLMGHRLPARVAGADLVPKLMSAAAQSGARVFLLGGEGGAAAEAGRRLQARYPTLVICGVHEPPVTDHAAMQSETIVQQIAASRADVLLVAFGHPKQERWIDLHRDRLPVSVVVGVGCSLDLIAGLRTRAPGWMQRSGLEWLHRTLHEPRRLLRRYAVDAALFLAVLVPSALFRRGRHATSATAGDVANAAAERILVGVAHDVRTLLQQAPATGDDAAKRERSGFAG